VKRQRVGASQILTLKMDNRHHDRHHERWNTLGTPCDYAHNASQEDPKGVYSEEKQK